MLRPAETKPATFAGVLAQHGIALKRAAPRVLQINLGKLCNQTCVHCHVGAGPGRKEIMSAEVADRCIEFGRFVRGEVLLEKVVCQRHDVGAALIK